MCGGGYYTGGWVWVLCKVVWVLFGVGIVQVDVGIVQCVKEDTGVGIV